MTDKKDVEDTSGETAAAYMLLPLAIANRGLTLSLAWKFAVASQFPVPEIGAAQFAGLWILWVAIAPGNPRKDTPVLTLFFKQIISCWLNVLFAYVFKLVMTLSISFG